MQTPRFIRWTAAAALTAGLWSGAHGLSAAPAPFGQVAFADQGAPNDKQDDEKPKPEEKPEPKPEPKPENPTGPGVVPPKPNPTPCDNLVDTNQGFLANVSLDRADGRYKEGQTVGVKFQAEKDAHVYLLYHQVDGACLLVYPNKVHPESAVKAKTPVAIPAPGEKFRFRVKAPFGKEALQVIASSEPVELLEKLAKDSTRAIPVSAEAQAELKKLMTDAPAKFAEHRAQLETFEAAKLPPPRPAKRLGLCIAVNRSEGDDKEHDPEFKMAMEAFAKMFTEHARCESVIKLSDEHATKANVLDAITKTLAQNSQPGDTIFISYNGHGGRIKAVDNSEQDGYDEFISMYESVQREGEDWQVMRKKGITDDTLARALSELPGRQIVLFLETCHGGGMVDGQGLNNLFTDEARRTQEVAGLNIIAIMGCLPDEVVRFKRGVSTFMPTLFNEAIEQLPKPLSVRDAYGHYKVRVGHNLREQFPNFFRPGDLLFGQEPIYVDGALIPVTLAYGKTTTPQPDKPEPKPDTKN